MAERSNLWLRVIAACLLFLTTVTFLAVLIYAKQIVMPMMLAWLLSMLLSPAVRRCRRWHIPSAVSAAVIMVITGASLVLTLNLLADPATRWIEQLPKKVFALQQKLHMVQRPITELQKAGEQVAKLGDTSTEDPIYVSLKDDSWVQSLLIDDLPEFSSSLLIVIVLSYFILATSDHFVRQLGTVGRSWGARRQLLKLSRQIRLELSRYLGTIALINLMLAVATGLCLAALGFPNPFFWGIVAGLLNFAPYVGPLITLFLLTLVGLTSFDTLAAAFIPPTVFSILTVLEGQLITPAVVGRRLSMSPTVVFIAVIFWTWAWGVGGALMAAPLLASGKILWRNLHASRGLVRLMEN